MQIFGYFLPHSNKSLWRCNWAVVTSVNKPERLFVPLMKVPFPALIKGLCMCRHVQSSYGTFLAPTPLPRTATDTQLRPRLRTTLLFSELSLSFDTYQVGQRLLSSVDEKPTWNPLAKFAKLFIALFFFYPSVAKRFQLHLELVFFFFLPCKLWFFTSLRCSSSWCSQQGREISSQSCFMDSAIWGSETRLYLKIMFFFNILTPPPTTFIIFVPFFMLKSTSAWDEFIWFGFCWHKWD